MVPQYREATPIILNDSLHMKGYGNALLRAYYNRLHLPSILEFFEVFRRFWETTTQVLPKGGFQTKSKGHVLS